MRIEPQINSGRSEPRINDNNLVLWLNDNGKTASNWYDQSGKNNHGTVYGATTPPPATPQALGYLFDGVDDYVDVGSAASLNNSNFSISLWYKSYEKTSIKVLTSKRKNSDYWAIMQRADGIRLELFNGISYFNSLYFDNYLINEWHNVVTTVSNSNYLLYVDGLLISDSSDLTDFEPVLEDKIFIANMEAAPTLYNFNGSIDEFRIYNRALSADEIWSHYITQKGKFGL